LKNGYNDERGISDYVTVRWLGPSLIRPRKATQICDAVESKRDKLFILQLYIFIEKKRLHYKYSTHLDR